MISALDAQQTFSLGCLLGNDSRIAPLAMAIEIEGTALFARIRMNYEFSAESDDSLRLFVLQKPADAVLVQAVAEGQDLAATDSLDRLDQLSDFQYQALDELFTEPSSHVLTLEVPAGCSISSISLEFVVVLAMMWHRGGVEFRTVASACQVDFQGRWDLAGLVGSEITFAGVAKACELQTLEAGHCRWSQSVKIEPGESIMVSLILDEKRPASIVAFSPSPDSDQGEGCAVVAVVAPVRTQAPREPVRLAFVVEVISPQEGFFVRSLVEEVCSILHEGDQVGVWLLHGESPQTVLPWSMVESVGDLGLGTLLNPESIGRSRDLWGQLQALKGELRSATHGLLATPGVATYPPEDLLCHFPIFVVATGRKPHYDPLTALAQHTGGIVHPGSREALDHLKDRMNLRLGHPLLSDFKVQGWDFKKIFPMGPKRVYSDEPTLMLGLAAGEFPKMVTLSGRSPLGQSLAQRVRVEVLDGIDFVSVYNERMARWNGQGVVRSCWMGQGLRLRNLLDRESLADYYGVLPQTSARQESGIGEGIDLDTTLTEKPLFEPEAPLEGGLDVFFDTPEPAWFSDDDFFGGQPTVAGSPDSSYQEPGDLASAHQEPDQDFSGPAPFMGRDTIADEIELFRHHHASVDLPSWKTPHFRDSENSFSQQEDQELASSLPEDLIPDLTGQVEPPTPPFEPIEESKEFNLPDGEALSSLSVSPEHELGDDHRLQSSLDEAEVQRDLSTPSWVDMLDSLDPGESAAWLNGVSIDSLGLAAAELEEQAAGLVFARLGEVRRRAVEIQRHWGLLLGEQARRDAWHQLERELEARTGKV